jgi:hypothetical protein
MDRTYLGNGAICMRAEPMDSEKEVILMRASLARNN